MGPTFLAPNRSLSTSAVWKGRQYMSHYLSPILSTKTKYEPCFWVLKQCFLSFIRAQCLQPRKVLEVWDQAIDWAIHRDKTKHSVGPVTILISHLPRLGWTFKHHLRCEMPDGQVFEVDKISIWQFKSLLQDACQILLVPKICNKIGLDVAAGFSISASAWHCGETQTDGFNAILRSGGLFTNRVKSKISGVSPKCVLCGEDDGMLHRLYHCSDTEELRNSKSWNELQTLPRSGLVWGLFSSLLPSRLFLLSLTSCAPHLAAGLLLAPWPQTDCLQIRVVCCSLRTCNIQSRTGVYRLPGRAQRSCQAANFGLGRIVLAQLKQR